MLNSGKALLKLQEWFLDLSASGMLHLNSAAPSHMDQVGVITVLSFCPVWFYYYFKIYSGKASFSHTSNSNDIICIVLLSQSRGWFINFTLELELAGVWIHRVKPGGSNWSKYGWHQWARPSEKSPRKALTMCPQCTPTIFWIYDNYFKAIFKELFWSQTSLFQQKSYFSDPVLFGYELIPFPAWFKYV